MFGWLGRAVTRHPWLTIGAWLIAAVALIAFAPGLKTGADNSEFLPSKYESVQAQEIADKAFPEQKESASKTFFLVKRTDGKQLSDQDQAKIGELAQALQNKRIDGVREVKTGEESLAENKSAQLITVPFPQTFGDEDAAKKNVDAVKDLRKEAKGLFGGTGFEYGTTGDVPTEVDNEDANNQALMIVTLGAIGLIIVLILAIFRSPIAAILPIIVVIAVRQVSNGVVGIVGSIFDLTFNENLAVIVEVVMFGIGTDYILFLLFRFRERLRAGDDKRTAMAHAVERVGEAIASAAAVVMVAFLALLLATFEAFGSLGPELAINVGVMAITALTLIPAIITLIGRAVFWPSRAWKKEPKGNVWAKFGKVTARRPLAVMLASGGILVALAFGSLGFKADYDFNAMFPQDTESAETMTDMNKSFPAGASAPAEVYLTSDKPLDQGAISGFQEKLKSAPGVGKVAEKAKVSKDNTSALVEVQLKQNPNSNEAMDLVKGDLRDAVHDAAPPGSKAVVGGLTASNADINSANSRDILVILPVAVGLIFLILALMLRSLVAPIYLSIVVVVNFVATLGASTVAFQNVGGKPGLMFMMPILLYLFVLAIGTDYNILMVARLREEAKEGHEPRRGAALAVQHAGPAVAAAGLILSASFAAMLLSPISFMQQIGFGVAFGIILSAFIMAMFFVPAATALVGRKAWWPGHGGDADPKITVAQHPPQYEYAGRPPMR